MKKCPYCAEEIQDEAIFCRYCRRDLIPAITVPMKKCPFCAEDIPEDAVFCGVCGHSLKECLETVKENLSVSQKSESEKSEPVVEEKAVPVVEEKSESVVEEKTEPVIVEKSEPVVEEKTDPIVLPEPAVSEKKVRVSGSINGDTVTFDPPVIINGNVYDAYKFDIKETRIDKKDREKATRFAIEQLFRHHAFVRVRLDGVNAKISEQNDPVYEDFIYWTYAIPDKRFYPTEQDIIDNKVVEVSEGGVLEKINALSVINQNSDIQTSFLKRYLVNEQKDRHAKLKEIGYGGKQQAGAPSISTDPVQSYSNGRSDENNSRSNDHGTISDYNAQKPEGNSNISASVSDRTYKILLIVGACIIAVLLLIIIISSLKSDSSSNPYRNYYDGTTISPAYSSVTSATTISAAQTLFSLDDVQGEWSVMTIDGVDAYDYAIKQGYPFFEYPVQENFTITSDSMVSEYYMDGCFNAVEYKIIATPNGFSAKCVNGSGTTDFKYDKNTDTLSYEFTSIHGLQEKRVLKHSSTDIMGEFAKQYSISYNTTYGKMLYDVQRNYRYDDMNHYFVSEIYALSVSSLDENADYSTITSELNELQIYIADNGDLVGEGYAFTFDQRHIGYCTVCKNSDGYGYIIFFYDCNTDCEIKITADIQMFDMP